MNTFSRSVILIAADLSRLGR